MITALQVRHLNTDELPAAGALVGRAFLNSPTLAKMFPDNSAKRAGALGEVYAVILQQMADRGVVLGAFDGTSLVGACALAEPGQPVLPVMESRAVGKEVSRYTSFGVARAFKKWRADIARREPDAPHWSLGPVAVEPTLQRLGIGAAMLDAVVSMFTASREPAFLATDLVESVPFFERYGFRELLQAAVQGVSHKFLLRPPA